jgi:hypothetical protein
VLSTDDQGTPDGTTDPPHGFPRTIYEPAQEALLFKLDAIKRDVDSILDNYFFKRPTQNSAKRLVQLLKELFNSLDKDYIPQAKPARRRRLTSLRDTVRCAAIATSHLTRGSEPPDSKLVQIHKDLSDLQKAVDSTLRAYGSTGV